MPSSLPLASSSSSSFGGVTSCKPSLSRLSYFPLNAITGMVRVKTETSGVKFRSICVAIEGVIRYRFPDKLVQQAQTSGNKNNNNNNNKVDSASNNNKRKSSMQVSQQTLSSSSSPTSEISHVFSRTVVPAAGIEVEAMQDSLQQSFDDSGVFKMPEMSMNELQKGEQTFDFSAILPAHALPSGEVQQKMNTRGNPICSVEIFWRLRSLIEFPSESEKEEIDKKDQNDNASFSPLDQGGNLVEFDSIIFRVYTPVHMEKWKRDTLQYRNFTEPVPCCCGFFERGELKVTIYLHKTTIALAEDSMGNGLMFKIELDNRGGSNEIQAVTCIMACTAVVKKFSKKQMLPEGSTLFKNPPRQQFFKKRFQLQVNPGQSDTILSQIELQPLVPATIVSPIVDFRFEFICVIEDEGVFATNPECKCDIEVFHFADGSGVAELIQDEQRMFRPIVDMDDDDEAENDNHDDRMSSISDAAAHRKQQRTNDNHDTTNNDPNAQSLLSEEEMKKRDEAESKTTPQKQKHNRNSDFDDGTTTTHSEQPPSTIRGSTASSKSRPKLINTNNTSSSSDYHNNINNDDNSSPLGRSINHVGRNTLADLIMRSSSHPTINQQHGGNNELLFGGHQAAAAAAAVSPGSPLLASSLASVSPGSPKLPATNPLAKLNIDRTGFKQFPDSEFFVKADKLQMMNESMQHNDNTSAHHSHRGMAARALSKNEEDL